MILDTIVEKKKLTLEEDVKSILPENKGPIYTKIKNMNRLFVLGEIKKASPSKGLIVPDFHVEKIAQDYDSSPIDAISILTEKNYFLGNIEYITEARKYTSKPILRKDFIIDSREIVQAKQVGANLVLLIVAMLDDAKLKEFYMLAYALGLECIVEVHNEEELQRALSIEPEIIGINNRDLHTFDVSLDTTINLAKKIPDDIVIISESGVHTKEDVEYLKQAHINGLLIGESFMRAASIQEHYEFLGLNNED